MLLAGDIGGTKTALAVYGPDAGLTAPIARAEFRSADFPGLEAIVRTFLAQVDLPVDRASFAVAGPVIEGRARATNLPWVVEAERLGSDLGLEAVYLLNDLEATARAVPLLPAEAFEVLNVGHAQPGGALAVIAPGTGLGEAFLTWDGARYREHPSEGGHADFAPTDTAQVGLLRYLMDRFDHVSVERVCSGLAIPSIYEYLRDSGYAPESPEVAGRLVGVKDRTPFIIEAAVDPLIACPLCGGTVDLFVSILGAEAANLALKVLATGGVYLGGGIPPRILPSLQQGRFMQAFERKGRLGGLLAHLPVSVILQPAALIGAASWGFAQSAAQ
ncbi:MAG: glucokinase [Chloroflexi bacterium]|nr:glucokinase [Chloroflexota bacterium]